MLAVFVLPVYAQSNETGAENVVGNRTLATTQNQTMMQNQTVAQNETSAAAGNVSGIEAPAVAGNVTGAMAGSNKVVIGVVAKNKAFNTTTITVPAGARVTINFDNQDSGIYHNIALYQDQDAKKPIYIGMPVIGRSIIAYNFVAPSNPGTYFFQDNKNPTTMKGQFIVQ